MMSQSTPIRLLNTRTGEFHFAARDPQGVQYAILSHVWSEDGEQSYKDLLSIHETVHVERAATSDLPEDAVLQRASSKIQQACARALSDGFEFIWIDFCCIDRSNGTEVSEAVNSAYALHGESAMCYAYLEDVDPEDTVCAPDSQFRRSRWHTRMWTLPELIAPKNLTFLASDWSPIGTKHTLARVAEETTGVDSGILTHDIPLSSASVARRMSWAAKRLTSRKEDEAYALMGLFGVKMPVTYGEGALAFFRLQEEILKLDSDQSLFVWNTSASASEEQAGAPPAYDESRHMLLAPCPAAFARSGGVKVVALNAVLGRRHRGSRDDQAVPTYVSTSDGLRATLPTLSVGPFTHLALLSCTDEQGCPLGLVLRKVDADIYAVGSMAWENTCARYRSSLRCLPWGANTRSSGRSDDINSEDEDDFAPLLDNGAFTRVVRIVKQYPGSVPFHTICIAHRSLPPTPPPAYDASSWSQRMHMVPLLSFQEFEDDLVRIDPEDRSPAGAFRWCCSTVADICGFVCCIMLGMVLLFACIGVLFLTYVRFSGGWPY